MQCKKVKILSVKVIDSRTVTHRSDGGRSLAEEQNNWCDDGVEGDEDEHRPMRGATYDQRPSHQYAHLQICIFIV